MIAPIILPVFTNVYNKPPTSLNTGVVPDILKISRVTPIKSGTVTNPNDYRPISVFFSLVNHILSKTIYFGKVLD